MIAKSHTEVIKSLKSDQIQPIYLFHGDEDYYIDLLASYCEKHLLDEGLQAFNQVTLYGKETDARRIIDEVSQFPMMSPKRVVILKEAHQMKGFADLLPIVEKPVPHSVLVIAHKNGKVDKRTKVGKLISDKALVFESKKLYDNQLPEWIKSYASQINLKLDFQSISLLAEFLGNDLKKISNELDKLKLIAGSAGEVDIDEVQEQIGISKDFNVFELQKTLAAKDIVKANLIINYFIENPKNNPIQMVLASLASYFTKVYIAAQNHQQQDGTLMKLLGVGSPFFVKEYRMAARNYKIDKLRSILVELQQADLMSKGVGTRHNDERTILKPLIFNILN